jgi:hypothetical protein
MNMFVKIRSKIVQIRFIRSIISIIKFPFLNQKSAEYKTMLSRDSNKEKFSEIYSKNFWHSNESGSGMGSEIIYTQNLRSWLIKTVPAYGVNKFVDAACGDFNWMKLVVPELDVEYIGFDIVDSVIEENIAKHSDGTVSFAVADICNDKLPDCDFLMIRDCLFHLSFSDINNFLLNLSRTNYKFVLTTTHILDDNHVNQDIISGHFRHIDLFKTPFNFKKNDILERCEDAILGFTPREMILIAKENVPSSLEG